MARAPRNTGQLGPQGKQNGFFFLLLYPDLGELAVFQKISARKKVIALVALAFIRVAVDVYSYAIFNVVREPEWIFGGGGCSLLRIGGRTDERLVMGCSREIERKYLRVGVLLL